MRCAATLRSGQHCGREAGDGSDLCAYHQRVARDREARAFYLEDLSPEDRCALAEAARMEGVEAEIAVLRVMIRRVLTNGNLDAARRGIDTLCRTLKARHDLDDRSTGQLAASLERVLDSLGNELDVPL